MLCDTTSASRLEIGDIRLSDRCVVGKPTSQRVGIEGWVRARLDLAEVQQITLQQLNEHLDEFRVLDVRRTTEWEAGHIE
jgi:predicted nucleic acid-binding protein